MSKLILFVMLLLVPGLSSASTPQVYCGPQPPASSVEVDQITVVRGGTLIQQLVVRDQDLIRTLLEKKAIYGAEINAKAEFVLPGYALMPDGYQISNSFAGYIDNRHFEFSSLPNGQYLLTVSYTAGDYHRIELARITLVDCLKF